MTVKHNSVHAQLHVHTHSCMTPQYHRALVPLYYGMAGHLQRSPENAIHKSIGSVENVRNLKPMAPVQMSGFGLDAEYRSMFLKNQFWLCIYFQLQINPRFICYFTDNY